MYIKEDMIQNIELMIENLKSNQFIFDGLLCVHESCIGEDNYLGYEDNVDSFTDTFISVFLDDDYDFLCPVDPNNTGDSLNSMIVNGLEVLKRNIENNESLYKGLFLLNIEKKYDPSIHDYEFFYGEKKEFLSDKDAFSSMNGYGYYIFPKGKYEVQTRVTLINTSNNNILFSKER